MLSQVEWGEYKLENLFEIAGTKSLDSNAIEFVDKGINFIGRTFENNGIQGKITRRNFEPNAAFTITATVIGNYKYVKYQKEPYYCSQNINKLTPLKDIFLKWNEKIAYFLVANIQKFVSLYDGQQGGYKLEDIKKHKINLPTKNGKIDFDFMESFVAELEAQRVAELEAYLNATGLKDYELTAAEQKALDDFENNSGSNWQEFKLIDIFKVKNTQCILSRDVEAKENGTPYLCASADNNAISSYISYNEKYLDKGNCIFIGGKTFVVTYQKNDFYSNDSHNLALYLKDSKNATLITQLFCISCIKCGLGYKYSWGDSISFKKIQNDIIQLPVKKGEIDFEFMAIFISAIQKLIIKDVVKYSDRKIAATKQCCKKASTSAE